MDKKKLNYFKERLLEERAKLLGVVGRNEDHGREADTEATQDPADKASNSYTKELLFSQSTNDRQMLTLIEEALERIEDGEFGTCVISGEEIPMKRLEAIPWAKYTIAVQEQIEKGLIDEEE
ncbi:MAG: TraR/DksA family transcriptional regulator [Acidobacteria bacterium]|nr:TraR/DksA family transcriptional regulator [Acidobacteriota bacterium]MBI3427778.1 TraR/DksA family transcriptional regulator [Acidobacteriota bacterium]